MLSRAAQRAAAVAVLGLFLLGTIASDLGATEAAEPALVTLTPSELLDVVRAQSGPVLVNVWATWCIPCREEMPDLLRLREKYRGTGLAVVLVSADFDRQLEQARRFLASLGVDFVSYHKGGDDEAFINALSPDWSGALPATFIFDAGHRLVRWWEGEASFKDLDDAVRPVLGARDKGGTR